jgi:hypothetical protein
MGALPIFLYDGLNNRRIGCKHSNGPDPSIEPSFFTDVGEYDPVAAADTAVARLWLPYKDIGVNW